MRNGAVGRSWKAERNTVKVNPHIVKKRRVKRGGRESAIGERRVYGRYADGVGSSPAAARCAANVAAIDVGPADDQAHPLAPQALAQRPQQGGGGGRTRRLHRELGRGEEELAWPGAARRRLTSTSSST